MRPRERKLPAPSVSGRPKTLGRRRPGQAAGAQVQRPRRAAPLSRDDLPVLLQRQDGLDRGVGGARSLFLQRDAPRPVPYADGLRDLGRGTAYGDNIVDCDFDKLKCEQSVKVVFQADRGRGPPLPRRRPESDLPPAIGGRLRSEAVWAPLAMCVAAAAPAARAAGTPVDMLLVLALPTSRAASPRPCSGCSARAPPRRSPIPTWCALGDIGTEPAHRRLLPNGRRRAAANIVIDWTVISAACRRACSATAWSSCRDRSPAPRSAAPSTSRSAGAGRRFYRSEAGHRHLRRRATIPVAVTDARDAAPGQRHHHPTRW